VYATNIAIQSIAIMGMVERLSHNQEPILMEQAKAYDLYASSEALPQSA
jgi:hypothetical protein